MIKVVVVRIMNSRRVRHLLPEYMDACPLCGEHSGTYSGRYDSRYAICHKTRESVYVCTRRCLSCERQFAMVYRTRDNELVEITA